MDPSRPLPFRITVEDRGPVTVVRVSGELELGVQERFAEEMERLTGSGRTGRLVVDLRDVPFMDSTGLRLLIQLYNHCRSDGLELGLVPGNGQVREVLRLTRMDGYLPLTEDAP